MAFVSSRTATVTTSAETSGPASPARGCGTNALGTRALGHTRTRAHARSRHITAHKDSAAPCHKPFHQWTGLENPAVMLAPSHALTVMLSPSCSHRHALQQAHGHVTALSPAAAARRQQLLLLSSRRRQAQGCGWRRHARPNAVPGSQTHGACTHNRARGPAWRCSR